MGDSSGGQPSSSGITNLRLSIDATKEQYNKLNPKDERWPCPFCIVKSNTKVQCNIHIATYHPTISKSVKKGFIFTILRSNKQPYSQRM